MQQTPLGSGRSHLLLGPDNSSRTFRQVSGDIGELIAVLYDQSADEWQRRQRKEATWNPRREVLIDVVDVARGATAAGSPATQVIPGRDIALRTVQRPVDPAGILESITSYLDSASNDETTIYIDDIASFVEDVGVDEAVETLTTLTRWIQDTGARGVFCLDSDAVAQSTIERLETAVDETWGGDDSGTDSIPIDKLREDNPTNFGYARNHWREARSGLENCSRNYPQARQIHETIDDPKTSPRTLGAALKALVTLGVLDTWSETVASTRYDLTAYDPTRMDTVGAALDATED